MRAFSDELRTWRESTDRYAAPASAAPRDPSLYAIVERQQEELSVADEELRVQAEELENAVAVAHAERRRYRELFQQAFDAMFLTDRAGVIVDANASAARLLATESRFLHGRPLAKLVDPADLRRVSDLAAQAHERSRTALSTQIRRADGSRIDVVLACVAVDEGTRVLWSTVPAPHGDVEKPVAERIASLERANRDAEELVAHERATRRRLEEENRMLRRFFAVVANDLAGPVNAVLSWASTLRLQHNAR
ncbi:MAG TPA: PAS domain-containing protein, partial [Labilithrix sp.]